MEDPFKYWPSDHMISSRQPIVASIPEKMLHLTIGYWLLSAHVERVGVSRMQDFLFAFEGSRTCLPIN